MNELTQRKVGDIATREIVSIDVDESLETAGKVMDEKGVTMLVVMENGKVVGILTAGDWFKSFYLHVGCHLPQTRFRTEKASQSDLQTEKINAVKKRAIEFKKMKLREVMNPHFKTIGEEASLVDAVHEMKATDLRRLLVVDKNGKITGVLGRTRTITELLSEL